ncbi:MAG TPA: arginase family protein, partial [Galbitalea sp.]|nr:arginase family protein [Galbitalea sp.]
ARGCASVIDEISKMLGDAPTYLSVDMDVVDPAFAPGVGDPQPGGMTSTELLYACRAFGEGLNLVGADVVEAIPSGIGQADATAVLAERAIREVINGIALRRRNGTEAS